MLNASIEILFFDMIIVPLQKKSSIGFILDEITQFYYDFDSIWDEGVDLPMLGTANKTVAIWGERSKGGRGEYRTHCWSENGAHGA